MAAAAKTRSPTRITASSIALRVEAGERDGGITLKAKPPVVSSDPQGELRRGVPRSATDPLPLCQSTAAAPKPRRRPLPPPPPPPPPLPPTSPSASSIFHSFIPHPFPFQIFVNAIRPLSFFDFSVPHPFPRDRFLKATRDVVISGFIEAVGAAIESIIFADKKRPYFWLLLAVMIILILVLFWVTPRPHTIASVLELVAGICICLQLLVRYIVFRDLKKLAGKEVAAAVVFNGFGKFLMRAANRIQIHYEKKKAVQDYQDANHLV